MIFHARAGMHEIHCHRPTMTVKGRQCMGRYSFRIEAIGDDTAPPCRAGTAAGPSTRKFLDPDAETLAKRRWCRRRSILSTKSQSPPMTDI